VHINLETLNFSRVAKNQNRLFSTSWFDNKRWLTVSEEKKPFFCVVGVLFGGKSNQTVTSIRDMKHLSERVRKHEASATHIEYDVKRNLFSSVDILSQLNESYHVCIQYDNEFWTKNRHVLGRIINCIKFCGMHELPLIRHDVSETSCNRVKFLDLGPEPATFRYLHRAIVSAIPNV
jgi:hypothetical protein